MILLAKITVWEEMNSDWSCGKEHFKESIVALDKALKCVEDHY